MPDQAYRAFVESVAMGSDRPSALILNRSPEHAAVIIEFLFKTAARSMRVVTDGLLDSVYGSEAIVSASADFLRAHPQAMIEILAEGHVDRASHPLLRALDNAGLGSRVSLGFVPKSMRESYSFNFSVADGESYQFEESRDSAEAVAKFRDEEFAARLERAFCRLKQSSVDAALQ